LWQIHRDTKHALQLATLKNEFYCIVADYTCRRNTYQ